MILTYIFQETQKKDFPEGSYGESVEAQRAINDLAAEGNKILDVKMTTIYDPTYNEFADVKGAVIHTFMVIYDNGA